MEKSERIVIVTGGGSGIGRAIAEKFAYNKDRVFILGRNITQLEEVARRYQNVTPISVDITDVTQVAAAVEAIASETDSVDVLVNCAGSTKRIDENASLAEASEGWKSIVEVNLTGTFNVTHATLPHMTRPGGRIIMITSVAALAGSSRGAAHGQAYAAAKAGLHGLTRTLVTPLGKEGITINCVAPGVIDHTGFFGGSGLPDDRRKANEDKTPMGRVGEPNDIAAGVLYLASDEAGFVTGEILNINGGVVFGR